MQKVAQRVRLRQSRSAVYLEIHDV
jgi:hypothetical protein